MKSKKKEEVKEPPFEKRPDLKKLTLFVTIVNNGQSTPIIKLFENYGCSAQFIQSGEGTAGKQVMDILGITDNKKEVIMSIIKKETVPDIKKELEAYFQVSKRNRGIGFTIPLTSIIGVKVYQFLADSL